MKKITKESELKPNKIFLVIIICVFSVWPILIKKIISSRYLRAQTLVEHCENNSNNFKIIFYLILLYYIFILITMR